MTSVVLSEQLLLAAAKQRFRMSPPRKLWVHNPPFCHREKQLVLFVLIVNTGLFGQLSTPDPDLA